MTQYYKMPRFSLANGNFATKVLVTWFMLATAFGLGVALLQVRDRVGGFAKADAERWIRGDEEVDAIEAAPFPSSLDELTLDEEPAASASSPAAGPQRYRKSRTELLQITHDHAFSVPVLLFVLLHLVALCSIPEWAKVGLYSLGFLSVFASLLGPWATNGWGPAWAQLTRVGGMGLTVTVAASIALCLFETWLMRPLRAWRGPAKEPAGPLEERPAGRCPLRRS